jgi:parallel beta-helix repeat protein
MFALNFDSCSSCGTLCSSINQIGLADNHIIEEKPVNKNVALALVVISLFCFAFAGLPCVKSQTFQAITINADGRIELPNNSVQKQGSTYVLTADLNTPLIIKRGNTIIDGANHTLQGPGADQNFVAITLMASNVTVKNLHVFGWRGGVYGAYNNNTIESNEFVNNYQAIAVYADDYIIENNSISGSVEVAILVDGGATRPQGDNNLITQNQIANNSCSFDILNSNGTIIAENNVTGNAVILTLGTQKSNVSSAGLHMFYLNNFVNNAKTLRTSFGGPFISSAVTVSPAGQWDSGSVGNYWGDYQSVYPNATEIGNSGIGNTPYEITDSTTYTDDYANGTEIIGTAVLGTAVDRYPLMTPVFALTTLNPPLTISPSQTPTKSASPTSILTRSPSVPEFPTSMAFVAVIVSTLAFAVIRRRISTLSKID